jgi:hypothetical protein
MKFPLILRSLRHQYHQTNPYSNKTKSVMKMNELARTSAPATPTSVVAYAHEKSSVEIDANNNSKLKRDSICFNFFPIQFCKQFLNVFHDEELSLKDENNESGTLLKAKKQAEQQQSPFLSCKLTTSNENKLFSLENHLDEEMLEAAKAAVWSIDSSEFAKNTSNPVRKLIEQMKIEPNAELPMIALSIGDPTIFSDIGKPDTVINAIVNCVKEKRFDGYTPSYGTETARQAVAKYYSKPDKQVLYKASDIYLANGCSQAIDLCITVLANRGQNILIPKPGFSIYKTLAGTLGIDVKYYQLIVSLTNLLDLSFFFSKKIKFFYFRKKIL